MSLLQMSFSGAVMVLAIVVVRALAVNILPKKVFILLWEVVLLRLLIPFSIPSMLSAYSFIRRTAPIQEALAETPADAIIPQVAAVPVNLNAGNVQAMQSSVPAVSGWEILWIAGVILCAVFFIVSYLRCYMEFRKSIPVRNEFADKWLKEHQLKRFIQIRQSDRISAPLTYGIFKPVILMPKTTDWENRQQLQYVLMHEYMHICCFDMVLKLIATLALCIHWFNPLVWVMYILFNRDIELTCDESVVRQFGEESKATYARTLISMEEKKSGLTPLYNNFSKNAIEERITAIMKTKKVTIGILVISVVIIIVIVILFATSAEKQVASEDNGPTASTAHGNEELNEVGIIVEPAELSENPEEVLDAARHFVQQRLDEIQDVFSSNSYQIKSLEHAYTYEDLEGLTLQVYQMNYMFYAEDPETVPLAGGMTMDEESWVVPGYPNSTYLVFRQEGETLTYLTVLVENDCFPGDEVFTNDLKQQLEIDALNLIMTSFYTAYFAGDTDTIKQYLSESFEGNIEVYDNTGIADMLDIREIKGLEKAVMVGSGETSILSLEFRVPNEDSLTYLTVGFTKENSEWKICWYGLEK